MICNVLMLLFQGLHSSEMDSLLESAWSWMLKLKEEIFSIAFQVCSDCDDGIWMDFRCGVVYDPIVVISQEAAE